MDVGVKVVRTLDSLFSVQVMVWCIDREKKQMFPIMNAILGHDLLDLGQKNPCVYVVY